MKPLALLPILLSIASCSSTGETAKTLIEQLQFEEGEEGCIRLQAEIDLNPVPFITTNAQLIYKKSTGEGSPDC